MPVAIVSFAPLFALSLAGSAGLAAPVPAATVPAPASPVAAIPAGDCTSRTFQWSDGRPKVNLRHVFCGEIDDGRPKGLHSARLATTSPVVREIGRRREDADGIYGAVVTFSNGKRKFSTFFPDHCTIEQLIRSIEHAGRNIVARHREWGVIGYSAPVDGAKTFCLDKRGQRFEIRLGMLDDGRVNTAFPNQ